MMTTQTASHELRVLGPEGDVKTEWDPSDPQEVRAAREQYERLAKAGYVAFKVDLDTGGKSAEKMGGFDPEARRIILARPVVGG